LGELGKGSRDPGSKKRGAKDPGATAETQALALPLCVWHVSEHLH